MRCMWLLAPILLLPFVARTFGQSSDDAAPPPLGDVAKKNRDTSKAKATKIFSDDNTSLRKNPIPAVALQGVDNSQEILDALHEFKKTHDPAETERVVHEWYDEQAEVLSAAIDANNRIAKHNQIKMEAAQDRGGYGYAYDGDYNKLRQSQLSEVWAQRSDAHASQDNWQVIMRIQQVFLRVRCDAILNRGKTPYDWFRIRNANGVGTY